MHATDAAPADLDLLVSLDVPLDERNITRPARRLGRIQSAATARSRPRATPRRGWAR